jgi:hypothetical protein
VNYLRAAEKPGGNKMVAEVSLDNDLRLWMIKLWCLIGYGDRKRFMKTLCKKAGVRYFRFHPIRHSGASILDNNNVPMGSIQRILGHENRTTTEIYLHSVGKSEREAMEAFERAREKPHTKFHTAPDPPQDKKVMILSKYLKK